MTAVLRLAALAALLAACGGGDEITDPHQDAKCDSAWRRNGFTECEAACANSSIALHDSGPSCDATTVDDHTISCTFTHDFLGVRGCCASSKPTLKFAECDVQPDPMP